MKRRILFPFQNLSPATPHNIKQNLNCTVLVVILLVYNTVLLIKYYEISNVTSTCNLQISQAQMRLTEIDSNQNCQNMEMKVEFAKLKQEFKNDFEEIKKEMNFSQICKDFDSIKSELKNAELDILRNENKTNTIESTLNSFGQQIHLFEDSLSTLDLKMNSDALNKVEIYGPYYPNQHRIIIPVSSNAFEKFHTIEPCKIQIERKCIVTLIATGHAKIIGGEENAQLLFLINQQTNLQFTNLYSWQFGAQSIHADWGPVNLTQDFIIEQKGQYTFELVVQYSYGSATIYLSALSFEAKVTYII